MSKQTDNYAALAAAVGFQYDIANNVLYGQKDSFDIIIYAADKQYPYLLSVHTAAKSVNGGVLTKDEIKELCKSVKSIGNLNQDGNNIVMTVSMLGPVKQEKLRTALSEALNELVSFLRSKGYVSCCSICGQNVEVSGFQSAGAWCHLCTECETKMRTQMATTTQQKKQKKENIVGGVVGALIGSLLGVVCIILLSQLGYVAALSGAIMAVGVLKGYELLGGKLTKKGIIISVVIMLFMTYLGDRLDWAIVLYRDGGGARAGYNVFECYRLVPEMISMEIIEMGSYIANLILLYVFLLLGAVPTIRSKVKEKKEEGLMVRIGSVGSYNSAVNQ